ncbi:MAG: hypothetical protein E7493_00900 [Ruminococcus albus]|nr:hypothetical protein [Ruminococcus albus]
MNYRKYEEMLNRVMKKCPLESGVQTLVFMYLDELFENCIGYEPVIIDNLQKSQKSPRYRTLGGYTDIMVVNSDFEYDDLNADPDIKLFFEVKALENNLSDHYFQFLGQMLTVGKGYFTNGKTWEYYELDFNNKEMVKVKEDYKEYINAKNELNKAKDETKNKIAEDTQQLNEKIQQHFKDNKSVKELFDKPLKSFELVKNTNKDIEVDPNEFLRLTEHFCEQIRKLNDAEGE